MSSLLTSRVVLGGLAPYPFAALALSVKYLLTGTVPVKGGLGREFYLRPGLGFGTQAPDFSISGYTRSHAPARLSVRGIARDDTGAPILREVLAFDRQSGVLVDKTESSGGSFTLRMHNARPVTILLTPLPGDNRNAVVLDNITPVP